MPNKLNEKIEETTIDTWKVELAELMFCVENRRPSKVVKKMTGTEYIPSHRDINNYVATLIASERKDALMEFVEYCKAFDFSNREEKDQRFSSSSLEEMTKAVEEYIKDLKEEEQK